MTSHKGQHFPSLCQKHFFKQKTQAFRKWIFYFTENKNFKLGANFYLVLLAKKVKKNSLFKIRTTVLSVFYLEEFRSQRRYFN